MKSNEILALVLCFVAFYLILSLLLIIVDILKGNFVLNIVNSNGKDITGIKYAKVLIISFIVIWFSYIYVKYFANGEEADE